MIADPVVSSAVNEEKSVLAPEKYTLDAGNILSINSLSDFGEPADSGNFGAAMRFGSGPAAEVGGVVFPRIILMKIALSWCH